MDKLNNFKQNPVKKLQYITKVRIVNRKPKLNDWIGLAKNDSYMITDYKKYNPVNNYNYKEIEIDNTIDNTTLTHKNIDSLNLVININSSISLFTFFLFSNTHTVDNIVYYLYVNENMSVLANYLYDNIYNNNLTLENVSFSDKFIIELPISLVNINTLYYYQDNYHESNSFNCYKFSKHIINKKKIIVSDFPFQPFSENSIIWFFEKLYDKQLHRYFNNTMIISTENNITINNYIYLNPEIEKCISIYYEWFQTSNKLNIDIKQFIVFIYSYYFIKIKKHNFTIFYNYFVSYDFDTTVSIYSENKFVGLHYNSDTLINLNDFIYSNNSKKINLNLGSTLEKYIFYKIIIINDLKENILDNDVMLIINENFNIHNIFSIKTKISCNDIYYFNTMELYSKYKNILTNLPKKTSKFNIENKCFYRIINEFNNHQFMSINANKFIFNYDKKLLNNLHEIDLEKYKMEVFSIINNYNNGKIILTYLIDDHNLMSKFIQWYNTTYPIIIVNILNVNTDILNNKPNIILINYFKELSKYKNKIEFIHPNFFFSEMGYYQYDMFLIKNGEEEKNRTYVNKYITNWDNKSKILELTIYEFTCKLVDKIKINNLSYSFDVF